MVMVVLIMQLAIIKALLKFFHIYLQTNIGLIRVPPLWMTELFAYPGTKILLLTPPRTDSSLRRITENLLKFTREYGDILACQYPLGQTLKNHP